MKRKITAVLVFLASSQGLAIAEETFTPQKPMIVRTWLQQLSAFADRMFAWL